MTNTPKSRRIFPTSLNLLALAAFCSFLGSAPAAIAQAAPTSNKAGQGALNLNQKQTAINNLLNDIIRKLAYLRSRGLQCTNYPSQVNHHFLEPAERKHIHYRNTVKVEIDKLKVQVQSKPASFANVTACQGYKTTAIGDFTRKKGLIEGTRKTLKDNVTKPAEADTRKLYFLPNQQLMGNPAHPMLVRAFEPSSSMPACPDDAVNIFRTLATPRDPRALLNKFIAQMHDLDVHLDKYADTLDEGIAQINKIDCSSLVAAAEPPKEAPIKKEPPQTKVEPPVRVPEQVEEPTPPVSTDTHTETKQGGFNTVRNGNGATEIPPGEVDQKTETKTETETQRAPEPLTENDRWKRPDWSKYDAYKDQIGAPNKIDGVDLNKTYTDYLAANSIKIESQDDAIRLQKAINATSIQVGGPDHVGPSVYQDGEIGSRTKSALYLMQNDPAYRDVLLQNLRRQGLIR